MGDDSGVTASISHVRNVSLGFKRRYRLSADDGAGRPGAPVGFAEKRLTAVDELVVFSDERRSEPVAVVRESSARFRASLTGYGVLDDAGECSGTLTVRPGNALTQRLRGARRHVRRSGGRRIPARRSRVVPQQ